MKTLSHEQLGFVMASFSKMRMVGMYILYRWSLFGFRLHEVVGLSERFGLRSNGGIFYFVDDVHHYESWFEYCQIAKNGPSF